MTFYGNMKIPGGNGMDIEDEEEMNIYANTDPINGFDGRTETENSETKRHQTPQHTGSDYVRNRSSRAAAVCVVLLCVLLLTAVIVLCVHIYTKSTNYTEERKQLLTNNTRLTEERDQLLTNNTNLTEETVQLLQQRNQLQQEKNKLLKMDGWVYYQSSFYFISSEEKNWTESRRDCTERGADLIIINNRKEQEIVNMISSGPSVWIGLTDSDVENTWKWVDGSTLASGMWRSGEPNGKTSENCVLIDASGWIDHRCHEANKWICEKKM